MGLLYCKIEDVTGKLFDKNTFIVLNLFRPKSF